MPYKCVTDTAVLETRRLRRNAIALTYYREHPEFRARCIRKVAHRRVFRKISNLQPLKLPPVNAACGASIRIKLRRVPEWERRTPAEREARRAIRSRLKNQRKRARRRVSGRRVKVADVMWLMTAQKARCFYCCRKLTKKYYIDHFNPLARGGTNERANIRLSCAPCNIAKSDKSPEQFLGVMLI